MSWYKTGTVAVTNGQTTVTGTGTKFATNARVGDGFNGPDGNWYEVTNIASETVIAIFPAYQGTTESSSSNYMIAPLQGYNKESADRLRAITDSLTVVTSVAGKTGDVVLDKYDVGLSNVDNTTDLNKPISTATQTALNGKKNDFSILPVNQGGTGSATLNTDIVSEGATNIYFTISRVLQSVLTGLSLASSAVVVATDTVLVAIGKLQAQVTARAMKGANNDITELNALTKPVTIAQGGTGVTTGPAALTALGAMPAAGSPVDVAFKSTKVGGNVTNLAVQGGYVAWNTAAGGLTGEMSFICNQGGGSGGFSWRSVNLGNTATGPTMTYTYAGALNVPGSVNQNSDRRLKINDIEIVDGLDRILRMRPVEYDRRDSFESGEYQHHEVGLIAQELFDVAPLLVTPANPDSVEDIWRVNYSGLIPYLISAIKTLKVEIDDLKTVAT